MTARVKHLVRWLPWLAAGGLFWLVVRTVPLADTWETLQLLGWPQFVILVLVNGLVLAGMNGRWWFILRGQGYRISFPILLGYRLAAFGLSYFTPGPQFGGEPLQVYLLERRHQVPRTTAVSSLVVDKSIELMVNFAFLAAGLLVVLQGGLFDDFVGTEAIVLPVVLLATPTFFLLALRFGKHPFSSLLRIIKRMHLLSRRPDRTAVYDRIFQAVCESETQVARLLQTAPRTVVFTFLISLLTWLIMIGEYWLMLTYLGVNLTPAQTIMGLTAVRIAFLLPVPGGIGSLEAGQIFALSTMGFEPAAAVSASLLIRARDILLGGWGLWWGTKALRLAPDPITVSSTSQQPLTNR
jgi:uncharacterized protein (TIRG00374 family)